MTQVRVESFCVSLDGFGAGPDQDLENPLGVGGKDLPQWFIPTRTFQRAHGGSDGTTGLDDDFAARGFLYEGVNLRALGYESVQFAASEKAAHVILRRREIEPDKRTEP